MCASGSTLLTSLDMEKSGSPFLCMCISEGLDDPAFERRRREEESESINTLEHCIINNLPLGYP